MFHLTPFKLMSRIVKIQSFGEVTEKGNQVIRCKMSEGFAFNNEIFLIASTPEAIEQYGLSVGQDISKETASFKVQESSLVDKATGELLTFKWLVPSV